MSEVTFEAGKMQDFISNIEFSLNFEDTRDSVRVRIGDIVSYDGLNAKCKEKVGKSRSLRSAIASNWLTLNVGDAIPGPINVKVDKKRGPKDTIVYQQPEYNALKGGAFDEFLRQEVNISSPAAPVTTGKMEVISEEDRIVKRMASTAPAEPVAGQKHEVFKDQVAVGTPVSSSTAQPTTKTHSRNVVQSEDYGAENTRPLNMKKKGSETPKANAFTVDDRTPRVSTDSTLAEVRRATTVIKADESQDAHVVKKVRKPMEVQTTEGVTLKKSSRVSDSEEIEGIMFKKSAASSTQDIDTSVTVRPGSEPIADLSGVRTQAEVNAIEAGTVKAQEEVSATASGANLPPKLAANKQNFLDRLPEDWGTMHWVQKEKFIMQLTDRDFIKFILSVEPIRAIQNACRKRLVELEKQAKNG